MSMRIRLLVWVMLVAVVGASSPRAGAAGGGKKGDGAMQHLFDAEVQATGKTVLSPRGPQEGDRVGGGEGRALGPRIKGTIRFALFENSTKHACTMQMPGEIVTDDGATIWFEAQGHSIVPDQTAPSRWKLGGAFRFQTDDERYRWLNGVLALWDGDFNMDTGKARYRLYLPDAGAGERHG